MNDKSWLLVVALAMSFLGNVFAWFHMNAQFRWEWAKSQWWILFAGIPILFILFFKNVL